MDSNNLSMQDHGCMIFCVHILY